VSFGEYVQVYAEHEITTPCNPGRLASVGNVQGTYLFMSLLTWKTLKRRTWVEMPLPGYVIDFINRKALISTSVTSDVEIRLFDEVIKNGVTYMNEVEFS